MITFMPNIYKIIIEFCPPKPIGNALHYDNITYRVATLLKVPTELEWISLWMRAQVWKFCRYSWGSLSL